MTRQYVGKVTLRGRTHALRGEWMYDNHVNMTECGLNAESVEHMMSGNGIEVTCINCKKGN